MINPGTPGDWRDLQNQVARILQECGLMVQVEKDIGAVRGTVNIDVYAEDARHRPKTVYLVECKHWRSAVPKVVVHAFRTVVTDYGANWGLIISSHGFQTGAFEAAEKSNVLLLDWEKFQSLFLDLWIEQYLIPIARQESDPLIEYTEPINTRIFRKANQLDDNSSQRFTELREKYADLAFLTVPLYLYPPFVHSERKQLSLPLRTAFQGRNIRPTPNLPDDVLDAASYRGFLDSLCRHLREGIAAFDELFGGRA